jgi:hypothetical protein
VDERVYGYIDVVIPETKEFTIRGVLVLGRYLEVQPDGSLKDITDALPTEQEPE